jgi:hypothetical protein
MSYFATKHVLSVVEGTRRLEGFCIIISLCLCTFVARSFANRNSCLLRAGAIDNENVRINEFLAVNDIGLDDEDRDESDWIEIYNAGTDTVDLKGWYLTDDANDLTKWAFPEVTLAPDAYLVVFASGKNRTDPLGTLHTNFKLKGGGEYLGLVRPDGRTVVSEFFPNFPPQAPDVSYGPIGSTAETALLVPGAPAKASLDAGGFGRFILVEWHNGCRIQLPGTYRTGHFADAKCKYYGLYSRALYGGGPFGDPGLDIANAF